MFLKAPHPMRDGQAGVGSSITGHMKSGKLKARSRPSFPEAASSSRIARKKSGVSHAILQYVAPDLINTSTQNHLLRFSDWHFRHNSHPILSFDGFLVPIDSLLAQCLHRLAFSQVDPRASLCLLMVEAFSPLSGLDDVFALGGAAEVLS